MGASGYVLGVDLGTTFTAAAVASAGASAVAVPLGSRSTTVPSVIHLGAEGELLVGDAAERRALVDPDRVARRFKRRVGDDTPLLLGSDAYHAHTLAARMIAWVVDQVTQRQGSAPDEVAVTHPASWGSHKLDLLLRSLTAAGVDRVRLISEPAAAAFAYAHSGRLAPHATVAVYDLGGATFDACLLRGRGSAFEPVGRPVGLPNLGGIDFDDAVLDHVLEGLGRTSTSLDPADPMVMTALNRLRRECVDAKEALSSDTSATIPVLLGELSTSVRITRAEFEALIAPGIAATIEALDAALDSAELAPGEFAHLLLTGGSSRIPLIAQTLSAHYGPGVRLDRELDPKLAVAIGAALATCAARPVGNPAETVSPTEPPMDDGAGEGSAVEASIPPARPAAARHALPTQPAVSRPRIFAQRRPAIMAGLCAAALISGGVGAHLLTAGHDKPHPTAGLSLAPAGAGGTPTVGRPAVGSSPATATGAQHPAGTPTSTGSARGPATHPAAPGPRADRPATDRRPTLTDQAGARRLAATRPSAGQPALGAAQPAGVAAPASAGAAVTPADSSASGSTEFSSGPAAPPLPEGFGPTVAPRP